MLLKFATYTNSEQQLITTIRSYNWTKLKKFWTQMSKCRERYFDGNIPKKCRFVPRNSLFW